MPSYMDANFFEAKKALEKAEEKFDAGNLQSAVNFAQKAKRLFPNLHGLAAHLESYRIHSAFDSKSPNWYAVLNVKRGVDLELIRKRYKELRALTHPDKNTCSAAEGAFKLVCKAWESIFIDLENSNCEGSSKKDSKEEERKEDRNSSCCYCRRQCAYIDSRKTVIECKSCKNIMVYDGLEEGFFRVNVSDGFVKIDVMGELNTKINVRGVDTTANCRNKFNVDGSSSILLNKCKGVELKKGDSIHMDNCTQINVNGSGNIRFGYSF